MIYVPDTELSSYCYVYDPNVLRCYKELPRYNSTIAFTDYFFNAHYIYRNGSTTFGSYSTINYDFIDHNLLTSNFYYRNDFADILTIFFIIVFFTYFIINKFVRVFFHGFREA